MKKACITLCCLAIIILSILAVFAGGNNQNEKYLRIHIRANSNMQIDQNVKYQVKEKIVEYLTPYVAECKTVDNAKKMVETKLSGVKSVADTVLKENGFCYLSNAKLIREEFPLRTYGDLTLESGYYDALIVDLGSGEGDNWWCVIYPPLCFTGDETNYVYKSKIVDIINDFFKRR